MSELEELVRQHLADWRTGWSMGTFGAIAEFHQDEGEALVVDEPAALARATARGGIRLDPGILAEIRAVAYETPSPKRHRWSQAVALCLPEEPARAHARSALTELGPDEGAIRETDRAAILFDMGLSLPQCDFCIRTEDPELLAALRQNLGRSLFDPASTAMAAILPAHPHRVAVTSIGRVEVYQKIGGPDTGGVSPPGPHTHVLPKLLKSGRTHSANTPVPDGYVPLAHLHPGNPVVGPMGEDRAFDEQLHAAFQELLSMFGIEEAVTEKRRILAAMNAGDAPENYGLPSSRIGRVAARLALRQEARIADASGDGGRMATVERWQAVIDPNRSADDEEDDSPGH